jgi:acyl carrier protein
VSSGPESDQARYTDIVKEGARHLELVDADGKLAALDSFAIVELLVWLEQRLQRRIPLTGLSPAAFESFEAIAAFLEGVGGR